MFGIYVQNVVGCTNTKAKGNLARQLESSYVLFFVVSPHQVDKGLVGGMSRKKKKRQKASWKSQSHLNW